MNIIRIKFVINDNSTIRYLSENEDRAATTKWFHFYLTPTAQILKIPN